jgi:Zn-dependent M32 family carboxypeptidase
MNTSHLLNSIVGFDTAYEIINNKLMQEISSNEHKVDTNNISLDHLISLKSLSNFSKIKYSELNKFKESKSSDPISEKITHHKKRLHVLRLIPHSLINDMEKARISLFAGWNKGIDKKTFCYKELDNYLVHYRKYCDIINIVFRKNSNYDALLNFNHPKFSCQSVDEIFKKLAPQLKEQYKKSKEFSKNIKVTKLDTFLIKNEHYKEISKQIKNNFNINNEQNINYVENNLSIFHDTKFMQDKFNHDFQDSITHNLINEIQNSLETSLTQEISIFEDYNAKFLMMTVSYFFGFYLLKSQQYIDNLSDNIKRILKCKSKISDNQNLYWLFNKQPDDIHLITCNEAHQMFYFMLQYVIERDLVNGLISASDIPDIWIEGIKHYFDVEVKADHIMQNTQIGIGKFGNCAFQAKALINSAMIFSQYEAQTKHKNFDTAIIKQFFNTLNSANIDYQTYALLDRTIENIDLYLQTLENKLL